MTAGGVKSTERYPRSCIRCRCASCIGSTPCDDHHDRQRLEDLQRRGAVRLAAFPRLDHDRRRGAGRAAMALLRHVDPRDQRAFLSRLRDCDRPLPPQAVSDPAARDHLRTSRDALRFRLSHDDITHYNAVQKLLYVGIIAVIVVQVLSGLAVWKPMQFSELASLFYEFPGLAAGAFPRHGRDRCVHRDSCRAGAAGAEDDRRDDHRRPARRRRRRTRPHAARPNRPIDGGRNADPDPFAIDLPAEGRHRPERARSQQGADRGDRPPQAAARRASASAR